MNRLPAALSALCLLSAAIPIAQAASFDCKGKPLSRSQRTICSDPSLGALDERMDTHYRQALANSRDAATLKAEQQQWLQDKRDTCTSPRCLQTSYEIRIEQLANASGPLLVTPGDYRPSSGAADAASLRVGILEDGRYQLQVRATADAAPRFEGTFAPQIGAARFSATSCSLTMMFAPDHIAVSGASPACADLDGAYQRFVEPTP